MHFGILKRKMPMANGQKLDDYRHTIKEVEKTFGKDKFPKFIQPIYTLGFKLS